MTDPAAHTPDVDTLVEAAQAALDWLWRLEREDATRRLAVLRYRRSHSATVSAALSDLADAARGNRALAEHNYQAGVAQTERAEAAEAKLTKYVDADYPKQLSEAEADRDRLTRQLAEAHQDVREEGQRGDRLARRVAELEAALEDAERRLVELDVHAASGDSVDDIRAARRVEKQLALQTRLAIRSALAGDGGGVDCDCSRDEVCDKCRPTSYAGDGGGS